MVLSVNAPRLSLSMTVLRASLVQFAIVLMGLAAPVLFAQKAAPNGSPPGQAPGTAQSREPALKLPSEGKPETTIPDPVQLMRQVEDHQREAESLEKTYIFRSVETEEELDRNGRPAKTNTVVSDQFWLDGVPVRRVVRKDGKDLSTGELAKEDQRIDREVKDARARRAKEDAEGNETDPEGHEEITVSRLLELGRFTNPRRVLLKGRDTIAIDYTGDPHAKTRNRGEEAVKEMAGTAWIDEQDRVLARVEGTFVHPFKVGGGLLINIHQGTRFEFEQTKVNHEVWLPARIDAEGAARVMLLVGFSGRIQVVDSDYRKFRTSSTILPDVTPVPAVTPEPAGVSH
jgi:hypothetical protein